MLRTEAVRLYTTGGKKSTNWNPVLLQNAKELSYLWNMGDRIVKLLRSKQIIVICVLTFR
jgi:hypothetical protein